MSHKYHSDIRRVEDDGYCLNFRLGLKVFESRQNINFNVVAGLVPIDCKSNLMLYPILEFVKLQINTYIIDI